VLLLLVPGVGNVIGQLMVWCRVSRSCGCNYPGLALTWMHFFWARVHLTSTKHKQVECKGINLWSAKPSLCSLSALCWSINLIVLAGEP
jgi:hypothetical protein